MVVGVDLPKVGGANVSVPKLVKFHFVHARAAATVIEKKVPVLVGPRVADGYGPGLMRFGIGFVEPTGVADEHEFAPKPAFAVAGFVEVLERHTLGFDPPVQGMTAVGKPAIDTTTIHAATDGSDTV